MTKSEELPQWDRGDTVKSVIDVAKLGGEAVRSARLNSQEKKDYDQDMLELFLQKEARDE